MINKEFEWAVKDDILSDAPRLVYADWLEEHGEADRAEFIRIQCELDAMSDQWEPRKASLYSREQELQGKYYHKWSREYFQHSMDMLKRPQGWEPAGILKQESQSIPLCRMDWTSRNFLPVWRRGFIASIRVDGCGMHCLHCALRFFPLEGIRIQSTTQLHRDYLRVVCSKLAHRWKFIRDIQFADTRWRADDIFHIVKHAQAVDLPMLEQNSLMLTPARMNTFLTYLALTGEARLRAVVVDKQIGVRGAATRLRLVKLHEGWQPLERWQYKV